METSIVLKNVPKKNRLKHYIDVKQRELADKFTEADRASLDVTIEGNQSLHAPDKSCRCAINLKSPGFSPMHVEKREHNFNMAIHDAFETLARLVRTNAKRRRQRSTRAMTHAF